MAMLVDVVLPIFALIGLGRFAAWRRLLAPAAGDALAGFVFFFALPPLLFRAVTASSGIVLWDAAPFMAVALLMFAVGTVVSIRLLGENLAQAGVSGLNCAFGNVVMMGVPVVDAAFGQRGLADLLAIIAFHSAVLLPVATVTVEAGLNARPSPWRLLVATIRGLVRNPIIMAIAIGFAWTPLGLPMPGTLARLLDLLAAGATPLALFCLGFSLPPAPRRADFAAVLLSCLLKNFAMPALVLLAARAAGLAPLSVAVATVVAAMPTGANAFMLAARYNTGLERSATALLVSTVVSLAALALLLIHFGEA